MSFVPASQTCSVERDVFINHEGGYWVNPVPAGNFTSRSLRTTTNKGELIDPFGNPKQIDVPNLYGKSRYASIFDGTGMTADRGAADEAGKTTDAVTNNNGNNDKSENNDGAERCRNISGSEGEIPDGQDGRVVPVHGSAEDSLALGQTQASGAQGQGTYSAEQLINQEIPLTTAYPERRIVHPGNHEERIPPTGGSEYNGTVTEPWKEPKSEANTYLRLMPTYESTTHYQLRTGRYYTEDQAPPHGMKLPLKTSLFKREW